MTAAEEYLFDLPSTSSSSISSLLTHSSVVQHPSKRIKRTYSSSNTNWLGVLGVFIFTLSPFIARQLGIFLGLRVLTRYLGSINI